jgi:AraC family transcriptional regulator
MVPEVEIRTLPATRAAYLRHVGPYGSPGITELWRRFEAWCEARALTTPGRRFFGVAQDNPNITPADRTRYDACLEVDEAFRPTDGVDVQVVRGGRFGCVPFHGTVAEIRGAWVRLLGHTLPRAGLEPDLVGAVELYESGPAIDARTGTFSCVLCMPLRRA